MATVVARCTSYDGTRATVVLEPGWIGWLRGQRAVSVDLEYVDRLCSPKEWRTVATRRWLSELPGRERVAIINALDFREVGSEPRRALVGGTVAP